MDTMKKILEDRAFECSQLAAKYESEIQADYTFVDISVHSAFKEHCYHTKENLAEFVNTFLFDRFLSEVAKRPAAIKLGGREFSFNAIIGSRFFPVTAYTFKNEDGHNTLLFVKAYPFERVPSYMQNYLSALKTLWSLEDDSTKGIS